MKWNDAARFIFANLLFVTAAYASTTLNDVHSRLNFTEVAEYHEPATEGEVVSLVRDAEMRRLPISLSGGKHSMGGQQFGTGTIHLNMSRLNKIHGLDRERGLVKVDSGVQWPQLIEWLIKEQSGASNQWGIRQKQTGADNLSIGGALSANIHGRGLTMKPFVGDVESFSLVTADAKKINCSRFENEELFRLVIGGYGLFGVITDVTIRLSPRIKLERKVEIVALTNVIALVQQRIDSGYMYGDYQFKTDERAEDFIRTGVFSTYNPVPAETPIQGKQEKLSGEAWKKLYYLAHQDKDRVFKEYSKYYLGTSGQIYWSDTHQLSYYMTGLDSVIDQARKATSPGSLMICEYYVPREQLISFMESLRTTLRKEKADLIYGTVRFIERDDETFLAWARKPWACIVINLRVQHDPEGVAAAQRQFQAVLDDALSLEGSYFPTYHRWATKEQVLRAYPQFPEFLRLKLKHDPEERFQSNWYRHYKAMFPPQ